MRDHRDRPAGCSPVHLEVPAARLRAIKEAMDRLKASKQAAGVEMLAAIQDFVPAPILAQTSRLNFSTRSVGTSRTR